MSKQKEVFNRYLIDNPISRQELLKKIIKKENDSSWVKHDRNFDYGYDYDCDCDRQEVYDRGHLQEEWFDGKLS